jgi:hypothetical protein
VLERLTEIENPKEYCLECRAGRLPAGELMNFSIRHRIEKLEAVDMRLVKRIVWEDGSGSAEQYDPECRSPDRQTYQVAMEGA